jgi:hypothetical protein
VGGAQDLGDKGAVPAVHHEDIRTLPLRHLVSCGRRAHFGGIGVVKLLRDEAAVERGGV